MNYVIKFVTYDYVYPLSPHVTNSCSSGYNLIGGLVLCFEGLYFRIDTFVMGTYLDLEVFRV